MPVKPYPATLALLAVLSSVLLAACGGGGGGGGGTVTAPVLNYSYKVTSLVGSPTFTLSAAALSSGATSGTVTLGTGTATDAIGYALNTATGVVTPASPYTVKGDLIQAWLMVCKPADRVQGNVSALNTGPKAIHIGMPDNAIPGSVDDLKGKTLDTYTDCAPSTSSVAFDATGGGAFFDSSSPTGTTFTAANFAEFLTDAGVKTQSGTLPNITTDVDQLRVFTTGSRVFVVSRSVQTPASENTWGSLGVWVSR